MQNPYIRCIIYLVLLVYTALAVCIVVFSLTKVLWNLVCLASLKLAENYSSRICNVGYSCLQNILMNENWLTLKSMNHLGLMPLFYQQPVHDNNKIYCKLIRSNGSESLTWLTNGLWYAVWKSSIFIYNWNRWILLPENN